MDAPRFDRFAISLVAPRTRRGALVALAAAFGGALSLVSIPGSERPEAVAGKKQARRKRGKRKDDGVVVQGPCGNGGPKHNSCKRHGQCCTGYCDKKRCRCRRPGDPCTEDRNCCPDKQGATCQDGVCRLATPGGECAPGETRACYSGPADTVDVGGCRSGVQTCSADETWGACAGEILPQAETCNGLDDDCDGLVDDGVTCPPVANATSACASGACQVTCNAGFAQCDGNPANGCETSLMTDVLNCGVCGNACGTCNDGTLSQCLSGACTDCGVIGGLPI